MSIAEAEEAILGLLVLEAMAQHGLSVHGLAKRARVPLNSVQKICRGEGKRPSLWTIKSLALALGVSIDALAQMPGAPAAHGD